jgi:hypothetical protein
MALFTTQGYSGKLVAGSEQTILDTFKDEEIKVSNNVLDLFDLGEIPGTYTQTLTLPGTKKNNAFFEHYYDISVYEPDIFNTNQVVPAYLDFDSFYLVNGYIQLQKVNVIENKFVDSYEVTLFGIISNFSVDTRSSFLTDLTNLSIYNHTSSLANITGSWSASLFNGDIVYPMAEYGQRIGFSPAIGNLGIDNEVSSLSVQDFKPAIRVKKVWDAIFEKFGYTYTGSFWNQDWLNNVYLICNNGLRTVVYPESIETYGQGKVVNISGSAIQLLNPGISASFAFKAEEFDYNNKFTLNESGVEKTVYGTDITTYLTGKGTLGFEVSKSSATPGSGAPQFTVYFTNVDNTNNVISVPLTDINDYMVTVASSRTTTVTEKFNLPYVFRTQEIDSGSYSIRIGYNFTGVDNFRVSLNPDDKNLCTFEITRVNQIADGQVVDIPSNMPAGNSGIRVMDFIRAIQKKFNLIIYGSKPNPNQFIVESFNEWYRSGEIKDFNRYINLAEKISFTPATSLGYRQIKFKDATDNDYVTTLFVRTNNRSYGEDNFYDTDSYFSQGELNVDTQAIASAQLNAVPGSAITGSLVVDCNSYQIINTGEDTLNISYTSCTGASVNTTLAPTRRTTICARTNTVVITPDTGYTITDFGNCSGTPTNTGSIQYPMYVPYYISDANYTPAKVLPRIFFYNGLIPTTPYYISGHPLPTTSSISNVQFFKYPYFDNYSTGSVNNTASLFPQSNARSLLFNNEQAVLGSRPTGSIITEYWDQYIALLYNPRTRLVECSAVIPIGEYVELELNDIVEFRGSYYHLRAINDYNLKTGQCNLQLLGPLIADTVSNVLSGSWAPPSDPCNFTFSASSSPSCDNYTATKRSSFQTVSNIYWVNCNAISQSATLVENPGPGEIDTITFCAESGSLTYDSNHIDVINNGLCT